VAIRVSIVTESFAPDINGVANSVLRVAEHLAARGHEPLVIAPHPGLGRQAVAGTFPYLVVRVPSVPLPGYPQVRVTLAEAEEYTWRRIRAIHNAAHRTLAPSRSAATALQDRGVRRVWLWRRGVDTVGFHPAHRSAALRRALSPAGEVLVGYVGRLAIEKRVDLLAATTRLPGVRVVIVGDGPQRTALQRAMPQAIFLGMRRGAQLARIYASLDVFVHTGPFETFGQTVQEALASGVPVVAPAAGGPVDLVDHDRTGLLVPPNDPQAIATAVADLAATPDRRNRFGENACAAVAGRTWQVIGDELIGHYAAVHSAGLGVAPLGVPA
jgi:phosphatidylinositol alpha 1,6-mannosyltransferase